MSYTFFANSPFSYSTRLNNNHMATLGPQNEQGVLIDVDRLIEDVSINGQNIKDLRIQEKKLTPTQIEIHGLNNRERDDSRISNMNLEQIKTLVSKIAVDTLTPDHKENIRLILDSKTDNEAQKHLADYHKKLVNEINFSSLDEVKTFFKNHLLKGVTDVDKKDFLASTIASGFHQSGLPRAATAYFTARANAEQKNLPTAAYLIYDPKRTVNISCANGTVTVKEDLKYNQLLSETKSNPRVVKVKNRFTGKTKTKTEYKLTPDTHSKNEGRYFAEVQSTIHIKAGVSRSPLSKSKYFVNLQGDPLRIDVHPFNETEITDKKQRDTINNALTTIIFDPRSTMQKLLDYLAKKLFGSKPVLPAKPINSTATEEKKSEAPKEDASPRPR